MKLKIIMDDGVIKTVKAHKITIPGHEQFNLFAFRYCDGFIGISEWETGTALSQYGADSLREMVLIVNKNLSLKSNGEIKNCIKRTIEKIGIINPLPEELQAKK